ncbi:MAG: hypothetical protein LBD49_02160 [Oscillospiraceae bacterium]|jgi:hypothetical protein|nr:hypothetical protein [Oscillospiraceae bacterium]
MSRSFKEGAKTALIAVLFVSAAVTARASGLFGELIDAVSGSGRSATPLSYSIAGAVPAEAARPSVLVVTDATGARAAARYDDASLDALYEKTASILNEALTSASEPAECSEAEWRAALGAPGVMYEYYSAAPLSLVRGWLGAPPAGGGGISVRRLCLVFSDGSSPLYFESPGGFYRAETASLGGEKTVPAVYSGAVKYEFELDGASAAPYMLLAGGSSYPAASVSNPLVPEDVSRAVLSALGIDARQGYTESDGTRVYITSAASASVSPGGLLSFRRASAPGGGADGDAVRASELARSAVAAAAGGLAGDARLAFTGLQNREGGGFVVFFDYHISGARVFLREREHAAAVSVTGGEISDMTLLFREYIFSSAVTLLPERQALAAQGGGFKLAYSDGGAGEASPFWRAEAGE